jgi:5-methylcytosine-specific restriction endonuclease McrA
MGRSCSTATDSFKYEQRSAMTKKMRYEILKRDNYTCQLCGRKAPEVILEVDHKQPVALGGKTVPDNLWTLCRDCNRGRGVDV